jgi:hypothetical protein
MNEIIFTDKFDRFDHSHADVLDELQLMAEATERETRAPDYGLVALLGRVFGREDLGRAA